MGKLLQSLHLFLTIVLFRLKSSLHSFFFRRKQKKENHILFLTAFYPNNAGYHWRAKKWGEELEKEGYTVTLLHALDEIEFKTLLEENLTKFLRLYLKRRYKQVLLSKSFDKVIVQRELLLYNDYGNLFLEKLLLKIHPDAILDFDDDISAAKNQPKKITNLFGILMMENGNKFNESLKLYNRFTVASNYLKSRVLSENIEISPDSVLVIPTCVDYDKYPRKIYNKSKKTFTLGWIGGTYNYHYLLKIIPHLNELSKTFSIKLHVISGDPFEIDTNFEIVFSRWSLDSEVKELCNIDIGLMPLNESSIAKGKGGFKLIQYMGLGIVSIASSVTINREIVDNNINSFLVDGDNWGEILEKALNQQENFDQIGKRAAEKIKLYYTFSGNRDQYINFINYS